MGQLIEVAGVAHFRYRFGPFLLKFGHFSLERLVSLNWQPVTGIRLESIFSLSQKSSTEILFRRLIGRVGVFYRGKLGRLNL